jgi:NAD(P)-dependent dehydrogenase (short-subunit alcohol dehydrogenase family)
MSAEKRVAVVTGASHGIGAALMDAYRKQGYSVVATARMVKQNADADIPRVLGDIAERGDGAAGDLRRAGAVQPP